MVSFRFHLISLTAVFVALALGIAVGATVVDRATVDALQQQLDRVERGVDATSAENARLGAELGRWDSFAEQSRNLAVAGRLDGVPVLVVGVAGIDRGPVGELRQLLGASGAQVLGAAWLTSRLALARPADAADLAALAGAAPGPPGPLRSAVLERLAAELAGEAPSPLLAALAAAGFVELEPPPGAGAAPAVPLPGTRFVVVSDSAAEVPNGELAVPFSELLARRAGARVLAAEAAREPGPGAAGRSAFVGPLREQAASAALLSTVDNLEDYRGRFSAVYALADLGAGRVGHFGVGPRATRLVPETAG